MRRVLVTGAGGFIGGALTRALTATGDALVLTDLALPEQPAEAHAESPIDRHSLRRCIGDIADAALVERAFIEPVDVVFHLAGIVSGRAESEFALGKRVNLDATIGLLERCRRQAIDAGGPVARFVYASSIAVFGAPLPTRIDDATVPAPALSYGAHKRACEVLLDDYTRRGFIDARALRLAGVAARPPASNGALSGFNSDLIREPLAGREYVCPVGPDGVVWIASLAVTIGNLCRMAGLDPQALGRIRSVTAPALAVSVGEIVEAMGRADPRAPSRIRFDPQPALQAQFGRWPRDCSFERARALGLAVDASLDALIQGHLQYRNLQDSHPPRRDPPQP